MWSGNCGEHCAASSVSAWRGCLLTLQEEGVLGSDAVSWRCCRNEPNGMWCCGHLEPAVYAALALAIKDAKERLSPELDGEVLAGPTTCGADLMYMEEVFQAGGLRSFDAISW